MDIEEVHEDAPRDELLYAIAKQIVESYCDTICHAKSCGYPIECDEMTDAVFASFAAAVNESGFTEDVGFDSPRTLWNNILKSRGVK